MVARRKSYTQINPKPVGYWEPPEPSRVFKAELRDIDPARITAGWSMPPVFQDYETALDAARELAFQWSAWVSVVAQRVCGFLVLTGAHEEFLETRLVLVQVGPDGEVRFPWATE